MAVSHVNSFSAASSSVTISSILAGDLLIAVGYNSGAATAPTVPAGWTQVTSGSANSNGLATAYKIAVGGETTSGTWTNATQVAVSQYRTSAYATGTVLTIGASGFTGASSTTASVPTLTPQNTSGSSWVWGVIGSKTDTALATAPGTMTTRTSLNPCLGVYDTNGGVSSFAAQTKTVASTGWRGVSIEVREILNSNLLAYPLTPWNTSEYSGYQTLCVQASSIVAPDGTTGGVAKVYSDGSGGYHTWHETTQYTGPTGNVTQSFYAQAADISYGGFDAYDGTSGDSFITFNLTPGSGAISNNPSSLPYTITRCTLDGTNTNWYLISTTKSMSATGQFLCFLPTSDGNPSSPNTNGGIYAWHPKAEAGTIVTGQPTAFTSSFTTDTGTFAVTEGSTDLFAASGAIKTTGTWSSTETSSDTLTGFATTKTTGTWSSTESTSDTLAASGIIVTTGSMAVTEPTSDALAASGAITTTGLLSVSEPGRDTFAASGTEIITGSISVTEPATDTAFFGDGSALPPVTGTFASIEGASDVFVGTGAINTVGTLAAAETSSDVFAASGTEITTGTLAVSETQTDTMVAFASGLNQITGTLSGFESGTDSLTAVGSVTTAGTIIVTEGSDTFNAVGAITTLGTFAATEPASDSFAATGSAYTSGSLAAVETATDTFAASGGVATRMILAAQEQLPDICAIVGFAPVYWATQTAASDTWTPQGDTADTWTLVTEASDTWFQQP